jgi:arginase
VLQDVSAPGGPKNLKEVASVNRTLSESVAKVLHDGRICLTLGGDHSLGIGTLHGASSVHNDLAVLWVDAHCDLNTPSTSWSKNMHGMSLSFVLRELTAYVHKYPEFSWITPRISASNLAYIGLRDVDPAERTIMNMLGINAYSMKDVDLYGIRKVTEMALDHICGKPGPSGTGRRPLHVSYDIDALDAGEVTTTGTPGSTKSLTFCYLKVLFTFLFIKI